MEDEAFDKALVTAAFELAAARGWTQVTVAEAARTAGLPLSEARLRFPGRQAILLKLGRMADAAALSTDTTYDGTPRDRLFDIIMRRIDVFQAHRSGVIALLRTLPADPLTALMLWGATLRSMAWLLDGAGIAPTGLDRTLRAHGLAAVWVAVLRAWMNDDSEDLSATMAALDRSLDRAEQMAGWLHGRRGDPASETAADSPAQDGPIDPPPAASEPFVEEPAASLPSSALPTTTPPPPPEPPSSPPV
jgi:ubiquinone biosynthesis protein COQ9